MTKVSLPLEATLPRLLARNARDRGDAPAMREKSMGIWRTLRDRKSTRLNSSHG